MATSRIQDTSSAKRQVEQSSQLSMLMLANSRIQQENREAGGKRIYFLRVPQCIIGYLPNIFVSSKEAQPDHTVKV